VEGFISNPALRFPAKGYFLQWCGCEVSIHRKSAGAQFVRENGLSPSHKNAPTFEDLCKLRLKVAAKTLLTFPEPRFSRLDPLRFSPFGCLSDFPASSSKPFSMPQSFLLQKRPRLLPSLAVFWALGVLLLIAGCGEPAQVTEYRVPKSPESQNAAQDESDVPGQAPVIPTYNVPADWVQTADKPLSIDTYKAAKGKEEAFLTVTPMTLLTDELLLANVNRWRGQVNLPPLRPGGEQGSFKPLTIDGVKVRYLKLASDDPKPGEQAMLVACFDHAGMTWYFKLFGDAPLTLEEVEDFLTFIQSVRFAPNQETGDE
jgi:hypothetical protein